MTDDDQSVHAPGHAASDIAYLVKALEDILVQKGLVDPAALDAFIETYEHRIGPRNGGAVVARAWSDLEYKARLLQNGTATVAELGFGGLEGEALRVVENSATQHNVIVCTLCSCYPWPLLGLPPTWYKSLAYRARVVREPRAVLREFGLEVPSGTAVRVWDSTADLRYLVLPQRPTCTEGLDEAALAALVTRDGMIGTAAV